MKLTPEQKSDLRALIEAADQLRIDVFEYRQDPNNPQVLDLIRNFLQEVYKAGVAHAKGKTAKEVDKDWKGILN